MTAFKVRAPALPIPTVTYNKMQQDQFENALRLYFNRLDQYHIQESTQQNSMNVLMWLGGPGGCC